MGTFPSVDFGTYSYYPAGCPFLFQIEGGEARQIEMAAAHGRNEGKTETLTPRFLREQKERRMKLLIIILLCLITDTVAAQSAEQKRLDKQQQWIKGFVTANPVKIEVTVNVVSYQEIGKTYTFVDPGKPALPSMTTVKTGSRSGVHQVIHFDKQGNSKLSTVIRL